MAAQNTKKWLNILIWICQVALGFLFLFSGIVKATQPITELAAAVVWPGDVPAWLVRFIGVSEAAGGLGLFLPSAFRKFPRLTIFASLGLLLIMIMAAIFHLVREEFSAIALNLLLGMAAAFVFWGRGKAVPISHR